jgi:hypothetical protein
MKSAAEKYKTAGLEEWCVSMIAVKILKYW